MLSRFGITSAHSKSPKPFSVEMMATYSLHITQLSDLGLCSYKVSNQEAVAALEEQSDCHWQRWVDEEGAHGSRV